MATYLRYSAHDGPRLGRVEDGSVRGLVGRDGSPVRDLTQVLYGAAPELLVDRETALDAATSTVLAPHVAPPRNIICVGKNYHDHAVEFGGSGFDRSGNGSDDDLPLIIFTKPRTSIVGPTDAIVFPGDVTQAVDYEAELAVIIGVGGCAITPEQAWEHIFGYTIVNDVTARDLQSQHRQWFLGKSLDTFCPMGPVVVTADELDARDLRVRTLVNGELRQDARTSKLIYDIPSIIATVSQSMPLLPGDVIATGTPAGVGIGFDPPRFLTDGDVVSIEIEGIGRLENQVRRVDTVTTTRRRQHASSRARHPGVAPNAAGDAYSFRVWQQ